MIACFCSKKVETTYDGCDEEDEAEAAEEDSIYEEVQYGAGGGGNGMEEEEEEEEDIYDDTEAFTIVEGMEADRKEDGDDEGEFS